MKKLRRKLKKAKKLQELVPTTEVVAQRAANLNPLSDRNSEPQLVEDVPKITNETIAEHREEVLKGARKYIYPLQHSKHKIILVTSTIITTAVVAFLIYCAIGLYRFYQHNTFLYRVTQVVPFPIAKVDGNFVEYENYLFELRHNLHYYQTQQESDFGGDDKEQLLDYRRQALDTVVNFAYIKELAEQNKVSVSGREVDARIDVVRSQNRLGNNNKVLSDVLRDYWGWSIADFKRSLKQRILTDKVVAKLDTETRGKAEAALARIKSGTDFGAVAKEVSEDEASKPNGGDFGAPISKSNPNVPPQITEALFKLKAGETSEIINTGTTLEILKVNQNDGVNVNAQHISFKLKDITNFIDPLKKKDPPKTYVKF